MRGVVTVGLMLGAVACGLAMGQTGAASSGRQAARAQDARRAVVVELFTSEGCSSCPAADALLAKLDAEYRGAGKEVIFLAEHVDYWDNLGWKDPFASKEFSARQRLYAGALKGEGSGVYTPQMVVDGRVGFVGSDEARARAAIEKAATAKQVAEIRLKVGPRAAGDLIRCEVEAGALPAGASVLVALVESGLTSDVKRGENGGRTLKHERVVRTLVPAEKKSDALVAELRAPRELKESSARVVAFVQDTASKAILGAAEAPLTTPAPPKPDGK